MVCAISRVLFKLYYHFDTTEYESYGNVYAESNICFCFSIDDMSCTPNGQDTAPDNGDGVEESDSESTGSHDSASNEEIGDACFSLHEEHLPIEQINSEPLNNSLPGSSSVPKVDDISQQLKVQTPENEKAVKGASDEETVEVVDKMDSTPSTSIDPASRIADNDSQDANKNRRTKDDDDDDNDERSVTSVASTVTIAPGLGDVQITHCAQISSDSKEESKNMQTDKSELETEALTPDDDVILDSLQSITQHNESERNSMVSTTDTQNTNFEHRKRCHSEAVAEFTNSCEKEDGSTENNPNNESSLMRHKRRNSMGDIESAVPECKKREMDSLLGNAKASSSAKIIHSLKAGSFETIKGANDFGRDSENTVDTEHLFTKSAEFVFRKTIVNLNRLKLDSKRSTEIHTISGNEGKTQQEDLNSLNSCCSKIDTDHCVQEVFEQEKPEEEAVNQNNENALRSKDCWDWTFRLSQDIKKFRKKSEDLFIGVGAYLKCRKKKKKVLPPGFEFFPADMEVTDSETICNVKVPSDLFEDHDFFYAFFCITTTDERRQMFENLVASVAEHEEVMIKNVEKVKNWGVVNFEKEPGKKSVTSTDDSSKNKNKKKKQSEMEGGKSKEVSNEVMDMDEETSEIATEVKKIVGNKKLEVTEVPKGNILELNAIFGSDIATLRCKRLLIGVATSMDNFKEVHLGSIVSSFENSLWLRFHICLNHLNGLQYKYCAVDNKINEKSRFWEVMHESGYVDRVFKCSDFRDSANVKYDGNVKFFSKDDHKKGFIDKFKTAWTKWVTSQNSELNYYATQNLEAFEHYAMELANCFTKNMDINWLFQQWRFLIRTLTFVRWTRGYGSFRENIDPNIFTESTLKCLYSLHHLHLESPVGECESFQSLIFKMSTIIFLSSNFRLLETMDTSQWNTYQKWLTFHDEKTLSEFSAELLSFVPENDSFFNLLRERCQTILQTGSEHSLKFSTHFFVFFEWAFLDGKTFFLQLPSGLLFRKEVCESALSSYISTASKKHLLVMTVSPLSNPHKKFLSEQKWLTSDIISCLNEVWVSRQTLPEIFLDLLNSSIFNDEVTVSEIKISFQMACIVIRSIIDHARYQHYRDFKFFINKFLHFCLDLLAVIESRTTEDLNQLRKRFYGGFEKLLIEVNSKDKTNFSENEIFYWANLLNYRQGYSQKSIEFIDGVVKKQLMDFLEESYTARNSIPNFCVHLEEIIKSLNARGWKVDCYKNINTALEEALIASIFSRLNCYYSDVNFVVNLDRRPLVAEAFCKAVHDNFPQFSAQESSFDVVMKNLEHQLISMILELMRKRNEVVQKHYGQQVNAIREAFIKVVCELQSGDILVNQSQSLLQKRNKFAELCQKLDVFDQSTVIFLFTRMDSVHSAIYAKVSELAKLLELTNKFQSCEIKIETAEFTRLLKEWESYPLNKLVALKPHSMDFFIVAKFPTFDDIRSVELYKDLMNSQIFSQFATEMLKSSFQRSEITVFPYQQFLGVEMKKVHQYYLQQADSIASGNLSVNQAKQLFKYCSNDAAKMKEMELFFVFLQKEAPNLDLNNKLETRKRQLKEIYYLGKSVAFMRVLRKLVDLLQISNLNDNFNQLEKLVCLFKSDSLR